MSKRMKRKSTSPYARDAEKSAEKGTDRLDMEELVKRVVPQVVEALRPSFQEPPTMTSVEPLPGPSSGPASSTGLVAGQSVPAGSSSDAQLVPGTADSRPGNDLMIPSVNVGIGAHITPQVRQKITSGEYVDLSLLLKKTVPTEEQEKKITIVDGNLVLLPKSAPAIITTIHQWTDAMLIYMSIYTSAHPEATQDLLKYISNVRLGAQRFGNLGFRSYDEQFRLKRGHDPSKSWGTVDQELWLLYMNAPSPVSAASALRKCYDYNNGNCSRGGRCPYLHTCTRCSGQHQWVNCRARFNTPGVFSSRSAGAQQRPRFVPQSHFGRFQGPARFSYPNQRGNSNQH